MNEILHLISEQHYLQFFFNIMLYSIYHVTTNHSMENFKNGNLLSDYSRNMHPMDTVEAKGHRLETATEISSNQHEEDGSLSYCRHTELADPKEIPQLNDMQKKHHTQNLNTKEIQNPHQIIRKGYVEKQTTSFLNRWQISYCLLTVSSLYFFEDESRINLRSCINFATLGATATRDELTITLSIHEYEDPIRFKVYSQRQAQWWLEGLGSIIQYHINSCKISFMQSKKFLYQQKDAITQKEFLDIAETGDILLMSTTDTQCAIQRFVTNSQYDHIGLVVNFNGEIKVFEANADQGVNIYNWVQFQADFHQYQKIAYRKLHHHKKAEMQPLVMKFIKSSIGKKYDLGAFKLVRKSSEDDQEPQRGYFCSQLVAKLYKKLGLLELEKASSNYWPVDFTTRGGLNLLDSAVLGEERLIILNKHIKYHS